MLFLKNSRANKTALLPLFPYEHTDGGKLRAENKYSRKQNRAFAPAHSIRRQAFAGKVNVPHVYKRRAPKCAAQRKTPIAPPNGRTMGFS